LFDTCPNLGCLICDRFEGRTRQENREAEIIREVGRGDAA
jgi:hypothetical protein